MPYLSRVLKAGCSKVKMLHTHVPGMHPWKGLKSLTFIELYFKKQSSKTMMILFVETV